MKAIHTRVGWVSFWLFTATLPLVVPGQGAPESPKKITARIYDSGFPLAHDTYNGISTASNGKIYYVLCSESIDQGAKMFCFNPATQQVQPLGDITQACGETGKSIPQGKSHVNFVESQGKLYFATHIGYYSIVDGMEKMGIPPAGYQPYPGGHLLAFDLATGAFTDLAIAPNREGILTMNMDTKRGRIYGITWPTGFFFRYDLAKKDLKNLGATAEQGENGKGAAYRTLCRSIAVNPEDGSAYFTLSTGAIMHYRYESDALETLSSEDLRKDYFGLYDPTSPGHMGYNWRQVVWHPSGRMVYGVHGNSGYLFRFDPRAERVELLERLTSEPSKRSGMFDQFSYGYLGFTLGPDRQTLHYLTGGPIYVDGKRLAGKSSTAMGEAKGLEDLHLITYHIPTAKYTDHGAVFFPDGGRPLYVNSIAVGKDGMVYTLTRIPGRGKIQTDLISFPGPLYKGRH